MEADLYGRLFGLCFNICIFIDAMAKTELNGLDILDGAVKIEDLDSSLIDGPALSASLRTLGTGSNQAVAGDDPRLSDKRPSGELCFDGGGVIISGSAAPAVGQTLIASSAGEAVWGYLSGSYGDPDATYLVVAGTGSLANERTVLDGDGINFIDGGSNGNFTILVDPAVIPYLTGSNTFSGANIFAGGISGSLQTLADGTPYIVGGAGITAVTGANGSITLQLDNPSPGESDATYLVIGTTSSLTNERSIVVGNGLSFTDGGANGTYEIFIDTAIVPNLTGTNNFTGQNTIGNLTGSLTKLPSGDDYLRAGNNITLVTGSDGSIEIIGGEPERQEQFIVYSATSSLPNALIINAGLGLGENQVASDLTYFVDPAVIPYLTGSNTFSGNNTFSSGLSGSLQNLSDGSSYLVAGSGINITSGSNGQVTISSIPTAAGADEDASYVVIGTTASLPNERALVGEVGEIEIVDGGANGNVTVGLPTVIAAGDLTDTTITVDENGRIVASENNRITLKSSVGSVRHETIASAIAAASAGDVISVGPGEWSESVVVPANVSLVAECGPKSTKILGTSPSGVRVTLNDGSLLSGFTVVAPSNVSAAILSGHATGTSCIESVVIEGGGVSGNGIRKTGSGELIIKDVSYANGIINSLFLLEVGRLVVDGVIFRGGTATSVFSISGGSLESQNTNVIDGTATDNITISGGSISFDNFRTTVGDNGIHVTSNEYGLTVTDSYFVAANNFLLVDSGVVPTLDFINIQSTTANRDKISTPDGYLESKLRSLELNSYLGKDRDQIFIKDVVVGDVKSPSTFTSGHGFPLHKEIKILTTDNSASIFSNGGNIIDVTSSSIDNLGTFTFQGTTVGHSILIGVTCKSQVDALKHWGHLIEVATASSGGSFALEILGTFFWQEVGHMSAQLENLYNYGQSDFTRINNEEVVVMGIDEGVDWIKTTIDGTEAYWSRIIIKTDLTTAPVFKSIRPTTNSVHFTKDGRRVNLGLSKYSSSEFFSGNIYGERGSVTNATVRVGAGTVGTTAWNHQMKNSLMNSTADLISYQYRIPEGTSTANGVEFYLYYQLIGTGTNGSISCLTNPVSCANVLVADSSGGITPVPRDVSFTEALDAKASIDSTFSTNGNSTNKIYRVLATTTNIQGYYPGDLIFFRIRPFSVLDLNYRFLLMGIETVTRRWTDGQF